MGDLTVLSAGNDPFRQDTTKFRQAGEWLVANASGQGTIHLRGLHYRLVGTPKPDGSPYANTDKDWNWVQNVAADGARWNGLVPFERIVDHRNEQPFMRSHDSYPPAASIATGIDLTIPTDLTPRPRVEAFDGRQPYRLVIFGEKSSLKAALDPLAREYETDLFLPTGEASDTMIYTLARQAAQDDRPTVIFYVSDCDPAGWQMVASVSRKLQALKVMLFPQLDVSVFHVGLTPDQVRQHGLPSTPLKPTERRADDWQEKKGVEQTEVDALMTLYPAVLDRLVRDALDPFFDHTLAERVVEAGDEWLDDAQQAIDAATDTDLIDRMGERAQRLQAELDDINAQLATYQDIDLPPLIVPEPEPLPPPPTRPLLDSDDDFAEQCRRLRAHKAYETDVRVAPVSEAP